MFALLNLDETEAKGRRKRRKKAHKHSKGRYRQHHQKCNAESKGKTCTGTCGPVTNNCKKTVDCGSCDCPEPCDACFICQPGPNTPGTCVVDPDQQGETCGSDGQICQPDGACACDVSSCSNPTPICAAGTCQACGDAAACEAAGVGDLCCSGACFTGICCNDDACSSEEAPDCVAHDCVCAANSDDPCDDGETCCNDGCFNLQTNAQNCGACGVGCPGDQVCQGGVCGVSCDSDFCPAASEICVDGSCQTCDVTCENLRAQRLALGVTAKTIGLWERGNA